MMFFTLFTASFLSLTLPVRGLYRSWLESDNRQGWCHQGTAFTTVTIEDMKKCALMCAQRYPECASVNFRESDGVCEMFDSVYRGTDGHCEGYIYMEISPPMLNDTTVNTGSCESEWHLHGSFCYQYQLDVSLAFEEAYHHCLTKDSNLASIHDYYENRFVAGIGPYGEDILLGATKHSGSRVDFRLVWSDASPVDYSFWSRNEPDRMVEPHYCVVIRKLDSNQWFDESCYKPAHFVCKKPAI